MTKESAARKPIFLSNVRADKAERATFAAQKPVSEPPPAAVQPPPLPRAVSAPPPPQPIPAVPSQVESDLRVAMMARVQMAVEKLRHEGERLAEQARADTLEIAFQIARRILEQELRTGPDALFALVRSAVRRAGDVRRVLIRVAPQDVQALEGEAGKTALQTMTVARVEIVGDATLTPGDVIVESAEARIDGRLGSRLNELHEAVQGEDA
ncbi:MAG TPA: FliH/SctL family protein [Myxococcales bacterium]|nr:FliH/SctL family protein [Myxococcales bacterium]